VQRDSKSSGTLDWPMGSRSYRREDEEVRLAEAWAVAQIPFLVWTGADPLRHIKFVPLRDDKDAKKIDRET
jgi:hypothetical protein